MKKNYLLKTVIVGIAALFGFSAMFAQDETTPKIVNLTEIVTPVVGADSLESFPYMDWGASAWGDFNNDGLKDLIVTGMYYKSYEMDENGDLISNVDAEGNELKLVYEDINGVSTLQDSRIAHPVMLYANNGDGTFTKVDHSFPTVYIGGAMWLDYDNDGNLDLFLMGSTQQDLLEGESSRFTALYRNQGAEGDFAFVDETEGTFVPFDIEGGTRPSRAVAVADFDNDGWVDIAYMGRRDEGDKWNYGRTVFLYKNFEGSFLRVENPVGGQKPLVQQNGGSVSWADYNNDGLLDLTVFGYFAGPDALKYDDFGSPIPGSDWAGQGAYYSGDAFMHGGVTCLYTNNGDGTFAEPKLFPAGEDGELAWGDYNNDGKLDYAQGGYSWWGGWLGGWRFDFFENKGDYDAMSADTTVFNGFKLYTNSQTGFHGEQSITMAWGDINNDGFEDIVCDNSSPSAVFFNNFANNPDSVKFTRMDILFETLNPDTFPQLGMRGGTICSVDFDNDGDLDIFTNGRESWNRLDRTRSFLIRNDLDVEEGLPANQAPTVPTNLKAETADGVTTFSWTASTDDLTPTAALRYNLYVKQDGVIKSVLPADLTTGRLKVNETLAPIMGTTYKMSNLEGSYEWGVQAIDNGKQASAFAKVNVGIADVKKNTVNAIGKKQAIEIKATGNLEGALNVYSIGGMNLYTQTGRLNGVTIEAPAGVYIVKIVSAEGTSVNKVIVK